jgi:ATP-binding cassette subfamily F protein uup
MKQGIKARGTRSKKRVESFHDLQGKIEKLVDQTRKELTLNIHKSNRKTKILARIKELSFSYNNVDFLINDFSVEIAKGDKIGILGQNGVGKTTILSLLAGELQPTTGEITTTDGLEIGMFTQKRTELDNNRTPFEILGDGADHVSLPKNRTMHVTAYFEKFLFNRDEINRPLHTFSGGERNRLQMALNLAKSADLWIFDEPTNDLDLESLAILESHLAKFSGSLIVVSHDRAFLSSVTNKIWLLKVRSYVRAHNVIELQNFHEMDKLSKEK